MRTWLVWIVRLSCVCSVSNSTDQSKPTLFARCSRILYKQAKSRFPGWLMGLKVMLAWRCRHRRRLTMRARARAAGGVRGTGFCQPKKNAPGPGVSNRKRPWLGLVPVWESTPLTTIMAAEVGRALPLKIMLRWGNRRKGNKALESKLTPNLFHENFDRHCVLLILSVRQKTGFGLISLKKTCFGFLMGYMEPRRTFSNSRTKICLGKWVAQFCSLHWWSSARVVSCSHSLKFLHIHQRFYSFIAKMHRWFNDDYNAVQPA